MKVFIQYISERFPTALVLLFALGYASLAVGIVSEKNIWVIDLRLAIITLVILTCVFFFFLLRQRVTDEFKDLAHDLSHYPERPLPRGLISKSQLLILGVFALIFEFLSVHLLGIKPLLIYLLVFVYSILMAKEFFISSWLNRHFTLYFLSHEVIFVLFGLFFISAINPLILRSVINSLLLIGVLVAAPVTVEVIRKFSPRYSKDGRVVADTYSTVWGRNTAILVLIGLSLFMGLATTAIKDSYYFLLFGIITTVAWLTFGKKLDKVVILIGVVSFLGYAILANLIWK